MEILVTVRALMALRKSWIFHESLKGLPMPRTAAIYRHSHIGEFPTKDMYKGISCRKYRLGSH